LLLSFFVIEAKKHNKKKMSSLLRSFGSKRNVKEFDSLENILPTESMDLESSSVSKSSISLFQNESFHKPLKKIPSFSKVALTPDARNEEKENISHLQKSLITSVDNFPKLLKPTDSRFMSNRSLASLAPEPDYYSPASSKNLHSSSSYHSESKWEFPLPTPPSEKLQPSNNSLTKKNSLHLMSFDDQDDNNHQDVENELNEEDVDDLTEYNDEQLVDEDEETLRELIATVFSKARHNHMDYILQKITQEQFNTNAKDEYGNTLLHICAQNNHRKLAQLILKHSSNTNIYTKNHKGFTALDYCEKYGFLKMYDWLQECGEAARQGERTGKENDHNTNNNRDYEQDDSFYYSASPAYNRNNSTRIAVHSSQQQSQSITSQPTVNQRYNYYR
jgi:hypothetical protein